MTELKVNYYYHASILLLNAVNQIMYALSKNNRIKQCCITQSLRPTHKSGQACARPMPDPHSHQWFVNIRAVQRNYISRQPPEGHSRGVTPPSIISQYLCQAQCSLCRLQSNAVIKKIIIILSRCPWHNHSLTEYYYPLSRGIFSNLLISCIIRQ